MTSAIDLSLTRRDALASFGALFLALLGMPQVLESAGAETRAADRSERLNGVFLGYANREQSAAGLFASVVGSRTTVEYTRLGGSEPVCWVGESESPDVAAFVADMIQHLERIPTQPPSRLPEVAGPRLGKWMECPTCRGNDIKALDCGRCHNGFVWRRMTSE